MADNAGAAGSFLSGMSNGMSLGMKYNDQNQQREAEDARRRREDETKRQEEEMRARLAQQQAQQQQQGMSLDPQQAMQIKDAFSAGSGNAGTALSGSTAGGGAASGTGAMGMPTGYAAYAGGSGAAAGGSAAGGTGAMGMSTGYAAYAGGSGAAAAGSGSGAAAGTAAGSVAGGSSLASGVGSAGPWGALAAVIAANEISAHNGGYRRNGWQGAKDLIGGKVQEQDANQRFSKYLGGYDDDKTGLMHDAGAFQELNTLDFSNAGKKITNGGTLNRMASGIKKIFS